MDHPRVLRPAAAAAYLGLSRATVYRLETVNRQLEVLLSGEGAQAAKLLMAPAPEGGE